MTKRFPDLKEKKSTDPGNPVNPKHKKCGKL